MKLSISENCDPNYAAVVIKCPEIKNHPSADRLEIVEIFGNSIIVGKGVYSQNDKLAYFPIESCLSAKFLSWANLFNDPVLNADGVTKSYFSSKGRRVKAINLRGVPSQGFLFKVSELIRYYDLKDDIFHVGENFDTVGDDLLVTKYIRPDTKVQGDPNSKQPKIPKWVSKSIGSLPRPIRLAIYPVVKWYYGANKSDGIKSQIVEGQWSFHGKTEQLGRNIFIVDPNDNITISNKIHGTSAIFANLLCKKSLSLFSMFKKVIGFDIPAIDYRFVYSSRSIIKNKRDGTYSEDVWGKHAKELDGNIPKGISVYGEILGWASPNRNIQKNYDYGITQGESEFWVYRVTHTNEEGKVTEFSWNEIEGFCEDHGLKHVPVYYKGKVTDLFPEIPLDSSFGENFLRKLHEKYLDKTCELCKTGVVNEGIVLKINSKETKPVLKFKSPKFNLAECKARDAGESDMEEES